jgi:hypothetical protein
MLNVFSVAMSNTPTIGETYHPYFLYPYEAFPQLNTTVLKVLFNIGVTVSI